MELLIFITLMASGYFVGSWAERNHYRSIVKREEETLFLPTTTAKHPMGVLPPVRESRLVSGSVVISVDYFKRVLAGLRTLFGGRVSSYETLVDRARREAVLRMKEQCLGASQLINVRIETSSISKGAKEQIGSVEVLAYGTAIYCQAE
ncbi:MAG: heavy metal-binding domain-containing protein [Thermodesulfobacteriota bacterium]